MHHSSGKKGCKGKPEHRRGIWQQPAGHDWTTGCRPGVDILFRFCHSDRFGISGTSLLAGEGSFQKIYSGILKLEPAGRDKQKWMF